MKHFGVKPFNTKIGFSWAIISQLQEFSSNLEEIVNVSKILSAFTQCWNNLGGKGIIKDFISDLIYSCLKVQNEAQAEILQPWILNQCINNESPLTPTSVFSRFLMLQDHISWFLQILNMYPRMINDIKTEIEDQDNQGKPLSEVALKAAIQGLMPNFESCVVAEERKKWVLEVNQLQSIAQQMRIMSADQDRQEAYWSDWSRVLVFKNYLHIVLNE